MSKKLSVICILMASVFWGLLGFFARQWSAMGLDYIQIASARAITAALIFLLIMLVKNREELKVNLQDIPLFIGTGIASILFFTACYSKSIQMTSLSTAVILLYTAPMMVTVMSVLFLHEKFTVPKIVALIVAFIGCVLVIGIGEERSLSFWGIIVGLGSGFGYALYSIFGTIALRKYKPMVVTTFSFIIASLGSLFFCDPVGFYGLIAASGEPYEFIGKLFFGGFVTAVLPYWLYTTGLKNVEASKASIMCSLEPIVATLLGVFVFGESLTSRAILGMALVLSAIVILNVKFKSGLEE